MDNGLRPLGSPTCTGSTKIQNVHGEIFMQSHNYKIIYAESLFVVISHMCWSCAVLSLSSRRPLKGDVPPSRAARPQARTDKTGECVPYAVFRSTKPYPKIKDIILPLWSILNFRRQGSRPRLGVDLVAAGQSLKLSIDHGCGFGP